jgi:hypothetical protein
MSDGDSVLSNDIGCSRFWDDQIALYRIPNSQLGCQISMISGLRQEVQKETTNDDRASERTSHVNTYSAFDIFLTSVVVLLAVIFISCLLIYMISLNHIKSPRYPRESHDAISQHH